MNKVLLFYPPGMLFQRGEDRCQQNIKDASAEAMRACNDLGYGAAILLQKGYEVKLRDYQTEGCTADDFESDMKSFAPDLISALVYPNGEGFKQKCTNGREIESANGFTFFL